MFQRGSNLLMSKGNVLLSRKPVCGDVHAVLWSVEALSLPGHAFRPTEKRKYKLLWQKETRNEGIGGPGRDRTDDLFHAMEARSQLRHRPTGIYCLTGRHVYLLCSCSFASIQFLVLSQNLGSKNFCWRPMWRPIGSVHDCLLQSSAQNLCRHLALLRNAQLFSCGFGPARLLGFVDVVRHAALRRRAQPSLHRGGSQQLDVLWQRQGRANRGGTEHSACNLQASAYRALYLSPRSVCSHGRSPAKSPRRTASRSLASGTLSRPVLISPSSLHVSYRRICVHRTGTLCATSSNRRQLLKLSFLSVVFLFPKSKFPACEWPHSIRVDVPPHCPPLFAAVGCIPS
jgi:hypothetical protein